MITAEDISKAANTSRSTVSAVFSGTAEKRRISPDTVRRVLDAARKLGYRPNAAARNLRKGKTESIGILIPAPSDNSYSTLVRDLNTCLAETGYLALFSFWANEKEQKRAAESILARQPDGIITVEPHFIPKDCPIPVVSLLQEDPRFDCVTFDRKGIVREAVEYLYKLGIRRIGNPSFNPANTIEGNEESNRTYLEEMGGRSLSMEFFANVLVHTANDYKHVEANAAGIVAWFLSFPANRRPEALILYSDLLSAHVIRLLAEHSIRVPGDVGIISCDNVPFAQVFLPPLTTFGDDPENTLAGNLAERLFFRMKHPDAERTVLKLHRKLYIRGSLPREPFSSSKTQNKN